ncbi:uncharacterized protein CBL_07147 [Carabus blaptoides fortunei]
MEQGRTLKHFHRTDGDGMENTTQAETSTKTKISKSILGDKLIYRPSDHSSCLLRPIIPTGKVIHLVPKYVPKKKKTPIYLTKPKDPKFVPYEPYKAATDPIIPRKVQLKREPQKVSKNNVDIHDLVCQMSELATVELNKAKKEALQNDETLITKKQWETEKHKFETDIKNLRETNTHLENQLKFQAQVNSELKTLLVAAVGEDLESRVQHLTEDKLALARELLNSANHLTSHREHTEWLSGQCEVWRSKFLASSLMVEELARWKSALTNKISELKELLKKLLDERTKIREMSLKTYNSFNAINEHHVSKSVNDSDSYLKTTNLMDLAIANCKMSYSLEKAMLKDLPDPRKHGKFDNYCADDIHTALENVALHAIRHPVVLSDRPDMICNAVVGAAIAVGKGQMFLQHPTDHATCCAHCNGEIKEI